MKLMPLSILCQMTSERHRIEAPAPTVESMPLPPSYEEVNGVSTSPMQNGSTDSMGYFLAEVSIFYVSFPPKYKSEKSARHHYEFVICHFALI